MQSLEAINVDHLQSKSICQQPHWLVLVCMTMKAGEPSSYSTAAILLFIHFEIAGSYTASSSNQLSALDV